MRGQRGMSVATCHAATNLSREEWQGEARWREGRVSDGEGLDSASEGGTSRRGDYSHSARHLLKVKMGTWTIETSQLMICYSYPMLKLALEIPCSRRQHFSPVD
jgi:hypothetical protein